MRRWTHATVDAWVIRKDKAATIIPTNLAMPRHPIQTELVNLRLSNTPAPLTAWIERIDEDHSNPRRLWQTMGAPEYLSALQVEQLETASALRTEAQPWARDAEISTLPSLCRRRASPPSRSNSNDHDGRPTEFESAGDGFRNAR